ncbi:MAG: TolC family protein [Ferruginibacter sp.]
MRRNFFLLCLLLLNIFSSQAQNATLTLKECIETALKNNIIVKQSQLLMDNAGLNYLQAKNNRLPEVQSLFNYSISSGRSIDPFTNGYVNQQLKSSGLDVQGSLPLFGGFRLKNTIKQNELSFAGANMEWQQRKDELTLQVILAYLQVLSDQDAIALAKQQTVITKQQVDRIEIIGEEGATLPGNISDLKGQYAGDKLTVVTAENNYESSVLALTQLMNIPYNEQLQFDRATVTEGVQKFESTPDEIYALATEKLAAVKASELRISSSAIAIKVAAATAYPSFALFGGASTNYSSAATLGSFSNSVDIPSNNYVVVNGTNLPVITRQDNFTYKNIPYANQFKNNISTFFGVSARIPIFNSFKTRTAIRLAKNDEKSSRLIADNIKQQLRQAIDQAYVNINATYKRYMALNEQADAYKESFRIASIRFENGVISSPEYLIAKNNLERTNANIITTTYEYLLRKNILDFYMGNLNYSR